MNVYTIKIISEVDIFANNDEDAIEKVILQLGEDISENAEISIINSEEYC